MITELVALFGAGVASVISPCSIVLVPAYLAMLTGDGDTHHRPLRLVVATVLFVAGFAIVFVTLGTLAASLGAALGAARQTLARVGGALLVAFGLVKLGARLPLLRGEHRAVRYVATADTVARPFVFGVAFGAVWSPCVGPLLGAALTAAAQARHAARGALLLGAYTAGAGTAFLAATLAIVASPRSSHALRRAGTRLERVAGAVIVLSGLVLLSGSVARLNGWLQHLAPPIRGL